MFALTSECSGGQNVCALQPQRWEQLQTRANNNKVSL